ncbi:hypothetical protein M5K25_014503 [Dendrobium thyrsiflorum]|uniref:Uncharacterized protein n=1 Tax=Dendrobium thyrsiflorum TaxID=117978 RepID=A0ABD0V3J0_DENTH
MYTPRFGNSIWLSVKVDNATSIGSRPSIAHVLVELDITKNYPNRVWIGPEKFGYIQPIEMEVFPNFCVHCKCIGHLRSVCHLLSSYLEIIPNNATTNINSDGNVNGVKDNLSNVVIPSLTLALTVNDMVVNVVYVVTNLPNEGFNGGLGVDSVSDGVEARDVVPVVGVEDVGPTMGENPPDVVLPIVINGGTNTCLFNVTARPISSTSSDVGNEVVKNSGGNSSSLELVTYKAVYPMEALVSKGDVTYVDVPIELISYNELEVELSSNLIETRVDHSDWLDGSISSPSGEVGDDWVEPVDEFRELYGLNVKDFMDIVACAEAMLVVASMFGIVYWACFVYVDLL